MASRCTNSTDTEQEQQRVSSLTIQDSCDQHQPVPCPNHCHVDTVPCCHVDKHLETCPLQLVDCQFASFGCDVRVPRKDLAGHMTENAQNHLMTATLHNLKLTKDLYQKIEDKDQQIAQLKEELKAKIDKQTKDIDTKLHDLDTKLTQKIHAKHQEHVQLALKLSTFTVHVFTLTKFTRLQASGGAGSWFSDPFYIYTKGYQFKLSIDTNGFKEAIGTHLTVYLVLLKGDNDERLPWPLKVIVTLDMLSQENNDHYSVTQVMAFNKGRANKYIGNTAKFYPLVQLEQNHFLKNDEVQFRLWLKVLFQ